VNLCSPESVAVAGCRQ